MFRCARCDISVIRRTADQRHCDRCRTEVAAIIDLDSRRRQRFARAKDLTPVIA